MGHEFTRRCSYRTRDVVMQIAIAQTAEIDDSAAWKAGLHLLNPAHTDMQQAIKQATAACLAKGKPVGTLAPIEADARRYLEMGMTFVAIGGDQGLLKASTERLLALFTRT